MQLWMLESIEGALNLYESAKVYLRARRFIQIQKKFVLSGLRLQSRI